MIELADGRLIERSGGELETTNNRQELRAAIEALLLLAQLGTAPVELASDSRYVIDGLTRWLPGWKRRDWKTVSGSPVLNRDLWEALESAAAAAPWVRLVWVKGHNGHRLNEAADRLATAAAATQQDAPAPVGSGWDVTSCTDAQPHHLREWQESAIAPAVAAANFRSFGPGTDLHWEDVREELLQARLEDLGATGSGQAGNRSESLHKLRQQYRHLAEGGWVLYGHDPSDFTRRILLCVKPNEPRADKAGRSIKYETPPGVPDRMMLLSVPLVQAQAIALHSGLELPPEVVADVDGSQGAIWAWASQNPRLARHLTEGGKKTASGISHGRLTIGSTGCWNFAPKDGERYVDPKTGDRVRLGRPQLHPDLQDWIWEGCPTVVIFDCPRNRDRQAPERMAARRTAGLLRKTGAIVRYGTIPGPEKGLDDWLAAGRTWDAIDEHLQEPGPGAVVPRRPWAEVIAPSDRYLGEVVDLPSPEREKLVCLLAAMGAGKSELIRSVVESALREGVPVISITHRVNLGAATCAAWGLPWADEARPGQPLRHLGFGCCIDSLCPESALRVNPDDWKGAIVILDEVAQVLQALLMGTGTAIAQRRVAALETVVKLLASARQIIASDAQLPQFVVRALEAMTGSRAYVIASDRKPFENVPCFIYEDRKIAQAQLVELLLQPQPRIWISTTAARPGQKNSTVTYEQLVKQYRPDLPVLRVDAETMADPNHDAAKLAENPVAIARKYPVIITSPAVAAGLSIPETVPFDAVFGFSGGVTPVADAVQALARVRYSCPRFLYAPDRAPGSELRIGSGDFRREQVLRHCSDTAARIVGQLVAAGVNLDAPARCALLDLWADYAATQNGQRLAYRGTMAAYLELEGLAVEVVPADAPADTVRATQVNIDLKAIAAADQQAFEQAVIDAPLPDPITAQELRKKRRLTREESTQLRRLELATRWGEDAQPTPELLEADDQGLSSKLMLAWLLTTPEARQKAIEGDKAIARKQARNRKVWAPDLCRETIGHRIQAAEALGLPGWMTRPDTFTADDPMLVALQANATAAAASITQVLGIRPGKDALTTLRRLLRLAGYQLTSTRQRVGTGNPAGVQQQRIYRVEPIPLPKGVTPVGLEQAWSQWLISRIMPEKGGGVPENPLHRDQVGKNPAQLTCG